MKPTRRGGLSKPERSGPLQVICNHIRLTRAETEDCIRKAQAGCPAARERLIKCNMRLVVGIASRYAFANGLQVEDLISAGLYGSKGDRSGLVCAIDKFDLSRGLQFSTYATNWIRSGVQAQIMHDRASNRLKPLGSYHSEFWELLDVNTPQPDEAAEHTAQSVALHAAIRTLPPEERAAIVAVDLRGLAYIHAAPVLGVTVRKLATAHKSARDKLRVQLAALAGLAG